MSRIAGTVVWLIRIMIHLPALLMFIARGGDRFSILWVGIDLLFLLFYIIAVRATFVYRDLAALSSP